MESPMSRSHITMRRKRQSLLIFFLSVLPCRAKVGTAPPLPGGTIAPNTPPEMVPFFAPAMAPLPGGTLSPATPPAMVPIIMPALAPNFLPPPSPGQTTFAPNTPPVFMPILMPAMVPPPGGTLAPNTPPAMIPMMMPAMAPPPGQTLAPDTPPAMIPMLMPAMVPGPGETFAPNTPPAMIPMMMPAMIPGPGETFAPNLMPAMIPMMVPAMVPPGTTLSPNTPPAMMPLLMPATLPETCFTNNGVYASTAGMENLIEWEYGVTVVDGITLEDFRDRILPDLEIQFANALVPVLFEVEGCAIRRRILQDIDESLRSSIIGLSSRPDDQIDESIACGAPPCFGVAGAMTIFTMRRRRFLQDGALEQMVLGDIQDAIESGTFDNMGDVVGVTYIGPPVVAPETEDDDDDDQPDASSSNRSRNIAIIGGAVGGGTALLLLAMGSLIIARNRRRDQLGNFPTVDGGESNIIPDIEDNNNSAPVEDIADDEFNNETMEEGMGEGDNNDDTGDPPGGNGTNNPSMVAGTMA